MTPLIEPLWAAGCVEGVNVSVENVTFHVAKACFEYAPGQPYLLLALVIALWIYFIGLFGAAKAEGETK